VVANFDRRVKTPIVLIPPLGKNKLSAENIITPIIVSLAYFSQTKDGHIPKNRGGTMGH